MFQQQQEELERIRQQQILEQEQEQERQRIEAARLEAERMEATLSNHYNSRDSNDHNGRDGGRQRRPAAGANVRGRGAPASRIPARPNTSAMGASRVGPGGGVRKMVGKLVMKRMADRLPLKYRDEVKEVGCCSKMKTRCKQCLTNLCSGLI
jgi:hypothetical protein